VAAYGEALAGLADGGADLILLETIFDTVNAKAAVSRSRRCSSSGTPLPSSCRHHHRPVRAHAHRPDPEASGIPAHAQPIAVGLNCARARNSCVPHRELSKVADTFISCYPNAGLPNPLSETGYDETPEYTSGLLREFAESGFLNIVGGCCGTTPAHIRAIATAVRELPPRKPPAAEKKLRLSGLEP